MRAFQKEFCGRLADGGRFVEVFNFLPDAYFFCKDRDGRFIFANEAEAVAFGVSSVDEILGKTDFDFFEPELAERYREEDRQVMETGVSVDNKAWLVPNRQGEWNWYLSSKLPLHDHAGEVIGIAGVMRDFSALGGTGEAYREFSELLGFVEREYAKALEVRDLARVAGMSVSSLERKFRRWFQCSPMQYVTRVRLEAASRLLRESTTSVGEIALDCGFYDQSHFNRHFKRLHEQTPLQFRRAVAADG